MTTVNRNRRGGVITGRVSRPASSARDALACVLGEVLGEDLVRRERSGLKLAAIFEA